MQLYFDKMEQLVKEKSDKWIYKQAIYRISKLKLPLYPFSFF